MKKILINFILFVLVIISATGLFFLGGALIEKRPEVQPVEVVQILPSPIAPVELDSDKLFQIVNEWRAEKGYRKYIVNQKLCDLASIRIIQIKNDWSHDKFVSTTKRMFGESSWSIAENLAKDFTSESDTLNSWLTSPSHRENLDFNYKYSCIKTDGQFAVQTFGNF